MSLCFEKFTVIRNGEIIASDVAKDKALEKIDNTASPCEPSSFCCRARVLGLQPTMGGAELAIAGTVGGYVSAAWEYGEETGQTVCTPNETSFLHLGDGSMLITSLGLVTYTLNVYQNADCAGEPECFTSFTSFGDEAEVDADGGDPLEYEPEIPLCEGELLFSLIFNSGATGITIDQFTGLLTVPAQDLAEPVSIVYQATCNGELIHIVSVTLTNPPVGLRLLFNDIENVPVADANSVSDWNTFFDLPANGTAFTSVSVSGDEVLLIGGANVQLTDNLFNANTAVISIIDETGSITGAGNNCFQDCTSLTSFDLSALTTAGDYCFYNCTSLTSFDLSALTTAGNFCFYNCTSLTSFDLSALTTAGNSCFYNCTSLTSFDLSALTTAGDYCFYNCTSLTSFDLSALTTAGNSCFYNCTSLTSFDLSALTTAGNSCFQDCTSLTSFDLSALTTAGNLCFLNCTSLTSFDLSALTTAGDYCFYNCTSLTSFDLSALTTAGNSCFYNCTSASLINIPLCAALGTTTGNNGVFDNIYGNTITINVPASLATADGGNPDGDLVSLAANNTATINYI